MHKSNSLLRVALAAALGFFTALPGVALGADPETNICARQVVADVKQRFGHDVTRVDLYWDYGASPESSIETGSAVAYVEQCTGYYWYEVFATRSTCDHLAHVGKASQYIYFRSVNGAC